ncbi:hypothetical protein SCP_0116680 [Sparassis crispa]|uniref:Importin N-terminal domain-containing protein n=1 Tax=Sparassis crispa TaxID=139825 RepID=A0A401G9D5_9APHY|nr:hypothetical protein SCP_0116680 [Sparassis crispa]GBE78775.1 hypothetical protein SCP_0116680 [Sparassis crispa]
MTGFGHGGVTLMSAIGTCHRARARKVASQSRPTSSPSITSNSSSVFIMSELPTLLLASLNPASRKQAEQNLQSLSLQPGFLSVLLRLVLEQSQDRAARLAGSVYLKNVVKNRWDDLS